MRRERRELGIDHALVGAVLIRRWGVRGSVAAAVERHHAADAAGHAAAIRLGDLIVHQAAGEPVGAEALRGAAEALGIDGRSLSSLLFEFPYADGRRRRASEPCPLSLREMDALRGLAEGKVYKQIAQELSLSVSTVRTHLHNVYRRSGRSTRSGRADRRDRGWLQGQPRHLLRSRLEHMARGCVARYSLRFRSASGGAARRRAAIRRDCCGADRDGVRMVAGAEPRQHRLGVRADGLGAQPEALRDREGREAVRVVLQDLALALGDRACSGALPRRRIDELLSVGRGVDSLDSASVGELLAT